MRCHHPIFETHASLLASAALLFLASACNGTGDGINQSAGTSPYLGSLAANADCALVPEGAAGPLGLTAIHAWPAVTGLQVPWEISFLPGTSDWLVTERPGRLRLVRRGHLAPEPVLTVTTVENGEGGLLGLALDPAFRKNSLFYIYYTIDKNGTYVNRVERFKLSENHRQATPDRIILDDLPWGVVHDGGRIHFGLDKKLYVSTGEGTNSTLPRDLGSPNGKILRLNPDGSIPIDNPHPGNPEFIMGLRNPEAFDWWDPGTMLIADNGPTGEYEGRTGGDKLLIGMAGADMGWPTIWHCESQAGLSRPILTWTDAVPPGGLLVYRGGDLPGWDGSILIASTGAQHLHRVVLAPTGAVASHEIYLQGILGRLRSVIQGPRGELYVTTTNCDGRGICPLQEDGIYRVLPGP